MKKMWVLFGVLSIFVWPGCSDKKGGDADADARLDAELDDISQDEAAEAVDITGDDTIEVMDGYDTVDISEDPDEEDGVEVRIAAEKFIPSYAIKYCSPSGGQSLEVTARFDLLVTAPSHDELWGTGDNNSWQSLKELNPDIVIVLYKLGPGEYNTATWGEMGEGWEWMKTNHGDDASDRWTAKGITYGTYLENSAYPNERLMVLGNENWRTYWVETLYQDWWGGDKGFDMEGSDGIFSDVTGYQVPYTGNWHREGHPDQPDHPITYYSGGEYLHDDWKGDMNAFFAYALPWFMDRGIIFTHNFGRMATHPEYWSELDSLPHHPYAAMEEAGFVCPYGGPGYKVWNWSEKVEATKALENVRVLMNCHGDVGDSVEGLARMDIPDADGTTGWDALWFSLASFLMAFNDVTVNGFMNFTIWGYCTYYWIDEFDPQYLHLGRAVGEYYEEGSVYMREFDDGWVVANPRTDDVTGIAVPGGEARVINHDNFMDAGSAPLVSSFDLASHRGAVLLKDGRMVGNEDNI